MSLNSEPAYVEYCALATRPRGMEPWATNENGEVLIGLGERFCRANVADEGEEVELCDHKKGFSHTGNLRTHVKGHGLKLAAVHKGTSSAQEVRAAKKFYRRVMALHDRLTQSDDPDNASDTEEELPAAPKTPVKAPPPKPPRVRRPHAPLKKDHTLNKTEAKKIAGVKGKCENCKQAKRKACPGPENSDCLVWSAFTDVSDDGEGPAENNPASSPLSDLPSDAE